jgi:hypothetical protein
MDIDKKIEKIEKKKKETLPHTRRGKRIAEKMATLIEKRDLIENTPQTHRAVKPKPQPKPRSQPMEYGGIDDIFTEPAKAIIGVEFTRHFPLAPEAPLPEKISMIEDKRLRPIITEFNRQLDDPNRATVDISIQQELQKLPLAAAFSGTMEAYFTYHLNRVGKIFA